MRLLVIHRQTHVSFGEVILFIIRADIVRLHMFTLNKSQEILCEDVAHDEPSMRHHHNIISFDKTYDYMLINTNMVQLVIQSTS